MKRRSSPRVRDGLLVPTAAVVLLLTFAASLAAHDLFLKPISFFAEPNSALRVLVMNGTFDGSENSVTRDRLRDISVVGPGGTEQPDTTAWEAEGDTSVLLVQAGESGTYLIGASILPRELRLEAEDFNEYLEHDGIPDVLEARRASGELDQPASERYSKHVKTLIQIGDTRTDTYATVLGYPAELVPLDNPYTLSAGDSLRVRALVDGEPIANQLIRAGGQAPGGTAIAEGSVRTAMDGSAIVPLPSAGEWYVKFIHMVATPDEPELDYESKWATLTFEVR